MKITVAAVQLGQHHRPGDDLPVFSTEFGNLGMIICSELWLPEVPRLLALQGADVIFAPVGGMVYELFDAWKCLLWARAIENHVYVVTSQNLFGLEDGIATIAGPERVLAERKDEGLVLATLDLGRLAWLRAHDETLEIPKAYRAIPGLFRCRRPELYGPLAEPRAIANEPQKTKGLG